MKSNNRLAAAIILAVCFGSGCCTAPDTSAELRQVTLIFKHYKANVVPDPALSLDEQAKIEQEGEGIEKALIGIAAIRK